MALITKRTVLILGAGASQAYGFPSGDELIQKITGAVLLQGNVLFDHLRHSGFEESTIKEFRGHLKRADPYSIDAYLEQFQSFWGLGKTAIASIILQSEQTGGLYPKKQHWYKYLAHLLTGGISAEDFKKHQLAILTFNYDRSLDEDMYRFLSSKYDPTVATDLLAGLHITHLYGQLCELDWQAPDGAKYGNAPSPETVKRAATRMKIICEKHLANDPQFDEAREFLGAADVVCCLGFGYHPENLERLEFDRRTQGANRFGTKVGIGRAEWEAIKRRIGAPMMMTATEELPILEFLKDQPVLHWPGNAA